jgi:hypothetical protein
MCRDSVSTMSEAEAAEQYQIQNPNRFVSLENIMIMTAYINLGKTLKIISKPQLKRG